MNGMALGKILTQSTMSNEPFARAAKRAPASLSKNLTRLISAAVVSTPFCNLLLSDPDAALATGYNGEHFQLTPTEQAVVTSLRASNIREFAAHLLNMWQSVTGDTTPGAPQGGDELQFAEVSVQSWDVARDLSAALTRRHSSPPHARR